MKKVLIALDYGPTAQKVAEVGFSMAKAMNAKVILLHVIIDPVYYSTPDYSPIVGFTGFMDVSPLELNSIETLQLASEHYLEKMKQHLGDKNIQIVVKEGEQAETIIKAATGYHADIIAIGSHSHKWLEEMLVGSVTEKVLKQSSIPLFIIPARKQE
ncbi:universal stress protein [Carboxylicivirga linearis]|uniref:Universal stress protein n=1 Tax=Carboxylicivirga linearis TaxID=1628157 RepID=A0ABS5K115_9BACT|nr:universal stress protein [Carboxylicivirga linearis]MBS2100862.1 universal stress protein [Carboxylicivirga linearis]